MSSENDPSQPLPSPDVKALAKALLRNKPTEIESEMVRGLSSYDVTALVALLAKRNALYRRWKLGSALMVLVLIVTMLILSVCFPPLHLYINSTHSLIFLVEILFIQLLNSQMKRTANALAFIHNPCALGPIIEAAASHTTSTPKLLSTLSELLLLMRPEDARNLTPFQRIHLYQFLKLPELHQSFWSSSSQPVIGYELKRSILDALGRVGDTGAIPYVEKLAVKQGTGEIEKTRIAAEVCLRLLKQFQDNEHLR